MWRGLPRLLTFDKAYLETRFLKDKTPKGGLDTIHVLGYIARPRLLARSYIDYCMELSDE